MIIMVKEEDPRYINRKSGVNVLSDVAEGACTQDGAIWRGRRTCIRAQDGSVGVGC